MHSSRSTFCVDHFTLSSSSLSSGSHPSCFCSRSATPHLIPPSQEFSVSCCLILHWQYNFLLQNAQRLPQRSWTIKIPSSPHESCFSLFLPHISSTTSESCNTPFFVYLFPMLLLLCQTARHSPYPFALNLIHHSRLYSAVTPQHTMPDCMSLTSHLGHSTHVAVYYNINISVFFPGIVVSNLQM